jgi:hypothetical protein
VRRLRAGEWIAGIGAAGLIATLFLPWFGFRPPATRPLDGGILNLLNTYEPVGSGAWDRLGWFTLVFVLLTIAVGTWLFLATAVARPLAQLVAAGVLAATIGTLGFAELALRVLVFQPGPNELTTLRYGAYLGLLAALLVAVGGWWAIKDERTEAPESAYTPPPPRPAPPERAS